MERDIDRRNQTISAFSLFMQLKQHEKAIVLLNKELLDAPDDKELLYHLGFAYRNISNFDKAEQCYLKALNGSGDFPDEVICCHLGILYQITNRLNESRDALERAVKINEGYLNSYNSLGITYREMRSYDKAIESYDNGIKQLFRTIHKKLTNSTDNKRIGFIGYNGGEWMKSALEAFLFFAVQDNMDSISWPTGEQAEVYYKSDDKSGLLWMDLHSTENKPVRSMLPNYLDTVYTMLRGSIMYSNLLSNKARVYVDQGKIEEAKALLKESITFIPENEDF